MANNVNVQLGWKVDVNACISCRACEMACKVEYDLKAGQGRRRRVIEKTITETATASADSGANVVRTFFLSLACNQCEKPACIAACPKSPDKVTDTGYNSKAVGDLNSANALWKDVAGSTLSGGVTGVVRVNPENCIGCRRCEWACPYGAPQYNAESQKIHKCEMCWQRISNTELHPSRRVGACVATCLGQAIKQDWVETDLAGTSFTVGHTRRDTNNYTETVNAVPTGNGLLDGNEAPITGNPAATAERDSQVYTNGDFVAPGSAGKGSAYVADYKMTKPALKIRNRIYVKRDGSGVE